MDRRSFLVAGIVAAGVRPVAAAQTSGLGNLLVTGFHGTAPGEGDVDRVRAMLKEGTCAGVILLRRNCISPDQVLRLTSVLRDASSLPPVIGIDQEGGRVARLDAGNGFLDWRSAAETTLMAYSDEDLMAYWTERAGQLAEVGINVNFAPVVDLNLNPRNPIIGKLGRSFGTNPAEVARLAGLFVRAHREIGVMTALKHFPGHGSSRADSHTSTADVSDSWQPEELVPFQSLIRTGLADSVMNAHVVHPDFSDAPGVPASLSHKSVMAIRTRLGFQGPIWTDDMQMAAVEDAMPFEAAALAAVSAGNTFLIYSNYRKHDTIETVGRALAVLEENAPLLSGTSVVDQVGAAQAFRRGLF